MVLTSQLIPESGTTVQVKLAAVEPAAAPMVAPCSQVKPAFVGTSIVQPHAARLGARPEKIWIANAPTPAATAFDIMISVWVRVLQSSAKSHGQRSGNLSQNNGAKTRSYVLAVLHPQKDPKRYFKKKEAASRILSIRASLEANSNIEQSAIRIGIQAYRESKHGVSKICAAAKLQLP